MGKVLLLIDLQNDYFPGGSFPLWDAEGVLGRVELAVERATALGIPIVIIQHLANSKPGPAPFFNPGTKGAEVHPRLLAVCPKAPVVVKEFADGFVGTTLQQTLDSLEASELLVAGMMTQNCVTFTAISKSAEKYKVSVLSDCCTTVTELLHRIALRALSTRVEILPWEAAVK